MYTMLASLSPSPELREAEAATALLSALSTSPAHPLRTSEATRSHGVGRVTDSCGTRGDTCCAICCNGQTLNFYRRGAGLYRKSHLRIAQVLCGEVERVCLYRRGAGLYHSRSN